MKKKFIFLSLIFIIVLNIFSTFALATNFIVDTSSIETLSPVALLMEANTGKVL